MSLWKSEEEKLKKSGRKWAESDYLSYRYAELFCEKCGKSVGRHDMCTTDLRTHMYCDDCVQEYVRSTPFNISDNIEVIADLGSHIRLKYIGGYYSEMVVGKICYFDKKGRFIKIKGKKRYI